MVSHSPRSEPLRVWLRRQMRGDVSPAPAPTRSLRSFVRLEDVLRRSPRTFGYDAEAWSVSLLRTYLTRELGLAVSEAEVTRRLRAVYRSMQETALLPAPAPPLTYDLAAQPRPSAYA